MGSGLICIAVGAASNPDLIAVIVLTEVRWTSFWQPATGRALCVASPRARDAPRHPGRGDSWRHQPFSSALSATYLETLAQRLAPAQTELESTASIQQDPPSLTRSCLHSLSKKNPGRCRHYSCPSCPSYPSPGAQAFESPHASFFPPSARLSCQQLASAVGPPWSACP
jgi:hypothetical protein